MKRKEVTEEFMPRAEDFRYEIKRRANYFMNMEEQKNYYVQVLELKNPLENMRGIVTLPQPAQWKVHALKQWLAERPLKPDDRDTKFLTNSIKQCTKALTDAVIKDPTLTQHGVKRSATMMLSGDLSTALTEGGLTGGPLLQVLAKQDAILGAVKKQNQQQSILNKITVLTQSIMGYNQEISIKQSTHSEIQNRILTVEMKIAENPAAEEGLKTIIAKHEASKTEVESQIKILEEKIADVRAQIDDQNEALKTIDEDDEESYVSDVAPVAPLEIESDETPQKKIKLDEQEQPQYELGAVEHQHVDQTADQQAEV